MRETREGGGCILETKYDLHAETIQSFAFQPYADEPMIDWHIMLLNHMDGSMVQ